MIVTTSMFKMNTKAYNNILKLFQEYYQSANVTGNEFIEEKLSSAESCPLNDDEIEKFVLIVTHKNFLEVIKNNFVAHHNLRNYNDVRLIMVIFLVLFASDQADPQQLFEVFKDIKCAFKRKILQYFWHEDNLIQTALTGCKFFEDEYVLNYIINPILNKIEILKKVDEYLYKEKILKRAPKPPTVPDHMRITQRRKAPPVVPLNTPIEIATFQATEIPKSLYRVDNIDKVLASEFEKNKLRAQKLLAQAKALDKHYCKPKEPVVPETVPPPQFKAKKAPRVKKNVEIKGNIAAVLREANLCIKEQEKEIKDIEAILEGGSTLEKYRELEENVRRFEQQKFIEDVERKHLEGLLTFEEAILAKKRLLECNKERFKEFMEEREEFLKKIEDWRENEQEKMRMLVKKGQEIERNAKESEMKLKEEKKNQVLQLKDERKKLLKEAFEKEQIELAKKVKLIEEIKTLHQLKSLHQGKEFDPTECPNLGLLCQMSIADLQKKLSEVKIKMEQQLEQKRKCIQKYKERQRQMIENVKNFITQTRMSKPKRTSVPIRTAKLAQSPDLDKLRGQLEHARQQRKSNVEVDRKMCRALNKYQF
jgi:hypothetical protein